MYYDLHKNIEKRYFCQQIVYVIGHEVQYSNLPQINIKTECEQNQTNPSQHEEKRGNQAENADL